MRHDICSQDSSRHSTGYLSDNRIPCRSGQSAFNSGFGPENAYVLLPLRPCRCQAMHEDVRTAAVSGPLVGHLLPQEKCCCGANSAEGFEVKLAENESHRTRSAVGFLLKFFLMPQNSRLLKIQIRTAIRLIEAPGAPISRLAAFCCTCNPNRQSGDWRSRARRITR